MTTGIRAELCWPGKKECLTLIQAPPQQHLELLPRRCRGAHSLDEQKADELSHSFIEGDNLEALKLLREKYSGRINTIYIDPPYNTGHKFIYRDDFRSAAARKSTDQERARQHSNWCNMMYPRLKLAYDLLSPDGALFISLDDRELGYLRLMCDEICGEENFVAQLVWETKNEAKGIPPSSMCIINHEYIVVYAKSKRFKFKGEKRQVADGFANPDGDPRGPWKRQYLQRFGQGFPERRLIDPQTGITYAFESPYTESKMLAWLEEGSLMFPRSPHRYPIRKEYFNRYPNPYKPVLSQWGLYSTKVNSEQLKALFQGHKCFDYPKPTALMQRLIEQSCPDDGLVLDIFAGSATTGHATWLQNLADGGKRRFILIQTPEPLRSKTAAYAMGYRNICDLALARLNRAASQLPPDLDTNMSYYRLKNQS